MIRSIHAFVAVSALLLTATSTADQAIAQANGCTACHQVDVKLVGPAYKEVAARYRGEAGAREMLIDKVRKGGMGVWGQIPMPPNSTISDADLAAVIDWVLANGQ
ncbi:MAG: c-type cytochrome [Gammaproteobacteria bacterium]|nr:c-type cytochrome [Gammaproteobacteria bacterium]